MTNPADQACIVGIGTTDFARWGGITDRSELRLACDAIMAAAADAGLPVSEVDGFASYSNDRNEPALLQVELGIPQLRFASMVWGGGGGGSCGALAHAVAAVESGQARCVVAFRALCQGQSFRFGQYFPWTAHASFTAPFGLFSPPQMAALVVQRHMHEFGTTERQLGALALVCRDNASRNPLAVMGGQPLDMDAYLSSRFISRPLRLYDCCLESDGACAVVVTSRARARDLRQRPVRVLAAGQGSEEGWSTGLLGAHNMPAETYASANSRLLGWELFGRAGITPVDVDVAQIYDAFTGTTIMGLEDYGFCGKGEGGPFVEDGNVAWPDGRLPINTSGGNLSEAYIHGFNLLVEGVRQIRGASTSQVADAEICFVSGGQGVAPVSAAILGR